MSKLIKISFPVFLLAMMVLVSGCGNRINDDVAVVNSNKQIEQNNTNQKKIDNVQDLIIKDNEYSGDIESTKMLIQDTEGWTNIRDQVIGIEFEYPTGWELFEKKYKIGKKIIFTDKTSPDFRLILETPKLATGFELHKIIRTQFYNTNDRNTNLHFNLLKPEDESVKKMIVIVTWQKGRNSDNWYDSFAESKVGDSGWMMISFGEMNQEYYLYIIDKFLKTFKFID